MFDLKIGDKVKSPSGHFAEVVKVAKKVDDVQYFIIKCSCGYDGDENLEKWIKIDTPVTEDYELVERIERLTGWDATANDILMKIKGGHNLVVWQGGVEELKDYGMIQIFKGSPIHIDWDDNDAIFKKSFSSQCQKLDAFKDALLYLSGIKNEKAEKIKKAKEQINKLQNEIKKLEEEKR